MKPQNISIFIIGTHIIYAVGGEYQYAEDLGENVTPEYVAEIAKEVVKLYGIPLSTLRIFEHDDNEMKLRIKTDGFAETH